MDVSTREHLGKGVPDELADTKLALGRTCTFLGATADHGTRSNYDEGAGPKSAQTPDVQFKY